jgi:hypothetical protein
MDRKGQGQKNHREAWRYNMTAVRKEGTKGIFFSQTTARRERGGGVRLDLREPASSFPEMRNFYLTDTSAHIDE